MANMTITNVQSDASIKIDIASSVDIYRTSIKDNFTGSTMIATGVTTFIDYYVEAGILYQYTTTNVATPTGAKTGIIDYDGSWLIGKYNGVTVQLNIIYDEDLSGFTEVVKDSTIETIGSQYPFIIRQAATKYKKMNFSGNINLTMNDQGLPLLTITSTGIYYGAFFGYTTGAEGSNTTYYNFLSSNGIPTYNNYISERLFRENVLKFLNDGKPKLLKTASEGLFLVRLTNLSFTPNKSLGRMIYNFSCEFTEIADASSTSNISMNNIAKYIV